MAVDTLDDEFDLTRRVEEASASCPHTDVGVAVGTALGDAARSGAAVHAVLALISRYKFCRRFDRAAFVKAALSIEKSAEATVLPLHTAWRLDDANVLLFRAEYLNSLQALLDHEEGGATRGSAHAQLQHELLSLATTAPTAFQGIAVTLVETGFATDTCDDSRADARVARGLLHGLRNHHLVKAVTRAHFSVRFLSHMLGAVLNAGAADNAGGDEDVMKSLLDAIGPTDALPIVFVARHGAALSHILSSHATTALPLAEASAQQECMAALSSRNATELSAVLQFMASGLPSAQYGDWFSRITDTATQTGGLPTLLNALLVMLPSDQPAALAAQAASIAGLKRMSDRSAEYVSHAKRRRTHLLTEQGHEAGPDGGGAPGIVNASSAEMEVRELVRQYAASGGELPAAIKAAHSNFRRKWWLDTCAPALTMPNDVPPDCDEREDLIRVLEATSPPLLPRGAGDSFVNRVRVLTEGGPHAAALLSSCDALIAIVKAGGLPTRMAAAARACVSMAGSIWTRVSGIGAPELECPQGTAQQLVRETLKAFRDACAAQAAYSLAGSFGNSPSSWQAAFAGALHAWPSALRDELRMLLGCAVRQPTDLVIAHNAQHDQSAESAAVLLVHLAAVSGGDEPHSTGDWHDWLSNTLCPVRLVRPDDFVAATNASCAYMRAATRAFTSWTLCDGTVHGIESQSGSAAAAALPASWLHRIMWLHAQLQSATGTTAKECAEALGAVLGTQTGAAICHAAGPVPARVTQDMNAGRFIF